MSYTVERQVLAAAYQTGMPAGSVIQFDNQPITSPPAAGYTRFSVLSGGEGRRIDITATPNSRTPGVIDVAIFVPPDSGTARARQIADQVDAAIANKTLTSGTTTVRTYGSRLDLIGRAGVWYQANVTIRFERDTR